MRSIPFSAIAAVTTCTVTAVCASSSSTSSARTITTRGRPARTSYARTRSRPIISSCGAVGLTAALCASRSPTAATAAAGATGVASCNCTSARTITVWPCCTTTATSRVAVRRTAAARVFDRANAS